MLPSVLQRKTTDHVPVLADDVRRLVAVQPGETVVDATFGAGGHAALLAADLQRAGALHRVDRDPTVQPYFESFKRRHGSLQPRLLRGEFSLVLEQLAANGVEADVVLLDLGVSSMQLDVPARGFSYATDAPLDMRMDPSGELTAADLVNEEPERELANIFKRYGEERYARQIARAIVRRRPIASTCGARRRDQVRDPRACALRRRTSGEARLPGAAHRGERRARRARARAAGGASRCCGRADASR